MIEHNPAHAIHAVSFPVVTGEIEAGYFADPVRRTRMKGRIFILRRLTHLAKHFGGTGEIEAASGLQLAQSGQYIVRAVDIGVHGRETVGERFGDETLRGQVVTLGKLMLAEHVKDRRIAFQARRMQS